MKPWIVLALALSLAGCQSAPEEPGPAEASQELEYCVDGLSRVNLATGEEYYNMQGCRELLIAPVAAAGSVPVPLPLNVTGLEIVYTAPVGSGAGDLTLGFMGAAAGEPPLRTVEATWVAGQLVSPEPLGNNGLDDPPAGAFATKLALSECDHPTMFVDWTQLDAVDATLEIYVYVATSMDDAVANGVSCNGYWGQ